ncbi:glycosyltransferase [bacterium]|jgi:glycosyltransferase involved in cell wall biosynthesis|nr:glycosyltransferase [bacterium]
MINSANLRLVTICIATFNRSATVAQLIQEILDFNLNDKLEILVIDDGSSDDTFEIISEFSKFENVSIYRNEKNLGWARTMMKYFNLCNTEFLIELPDDDILYKDGIEDLLPILLEVNPDFLCTRWIDIKRSLYPRRGSDNLKEISLKKVRVKTGHSPGCVYRTSLIKNAEAIIMNRIAKGCIAADFYPQVMLMLVAKLNGAKLYDCPVLIGGYRADGPMESNLKDSQGHGYLSFQSLFAQHLGFQEFYEEMLLMHKDSRYSGELKFMIEHHDMSFYNMVDDAISLHSPALANHLRSGSVRNFLNPLKGLQYFIKYVSFKVKNLIINK